MIYFISDTHFNHKNICRGTSQWGLMPDGTYDKSKRRGVRPFDTIEEMNTTIIKDINRVVQYNDVLYHLGDFAFGNKDEIPKLRDRIACQTIHLIPGNHDIKYIKKRPELYEGFASIQRYEELWYKKILFSLCHYPLGSWNEIGKGGINLFGHCHGNYKRCIGRQMDVGTDCWDEPQSIERVLKIMSYIEPELVDGHDENTNYG